MAGNQVGDCAEGGGASGPDVDCPSFRGELCQGAQSAFRGVVDVDEVADLVAAAVEVQWESGRGAGCEPCDHPRVAAGLDDLRLAVASPTRPSTTSPTATSNPPRTPPPPPPASLAVSTHRAANNSSKASHHPSARTRATTPSNACCTWQASTRPDGRGEAAAHVVRAAPALGFAAFLVGDPLTRAVPGAAVPAPGRGDVSGASPTRLHVRFDDVLGAVASPARGSDSCLSFGCLWRRSCIACPARMVRRDRERQFGDLAYGAQRHDQAGGGRRYGHHPHCGTNTNGRVQKAAQCRLPARGE